MNIKFIENLLLRIRERQKVCSDRLLSGSCQTFEEYRGSIGKLQGLKEAEEVIRKLYKETYEIVVFENQELNQDAEV